MHFDIVDVTGLHLDLADQAAPGLIAGLYVIGSAAAGDYSPGSSDIDFVAVLAGQPTASQLQSLHSVHDSIPRRPVYEGVYVEQAALSDPPQDHEPVPHAYAGRFHPAEACCLLTPMTWIDLVHRGVAVRGSPPDQLGIPLDPAVLKSYLAKNVRTYWTPLISEAISNLAAAEDQKPVNGVMIAWTLLSVARAHYSFHVGGLISKQDAGQHAAGLFPQAGALVDRLARWRTERSVRFTAGDAKLALQVCTSMIDDVTAREPFSALT